MLAPMPADELYAPASARSAMDKYKPAPSGTLVCMTCDGVLWHISDSETCWCCGEPGLDRNHMTREQRENMPTWTPSYSEMAMSQSEEASP